MRKVMLAVLDVTALLWAVASAGYAIGWLTHWYLLSSP
jgi:hypothetical protein